MRHLKFYLFFTLIQICTVANAQDNENLCTKGLSYGEFISLFQITTTENLVNVLQQKCFEEHGEQLAFFKTYERKYEKSNYNTTTYYNELFAIRNGKAFEYRCSEYSVCQKLLRKINDIAIYFCPSLLDSNTAIYILRDKLHVIEMSDIPTESIGYSYGFRYRDVNINDLNRFRDSKLKDDFPKSIYERARLEYRYERIESDNNSTTITLKTGDKVYLEASGEITLGASAGKGGPTGINGYTSYSFIPNFRHGSLLFRVGLSSWDVVNDEKYFVAVNPGNLQFQVNDKNTLDNSGEFRINIKIIRAQ